MTKKQKRTTLVICVFVIALTASALVLSALNQSIAYFYTPSALADLETPPEGLIRLGGMVAVGSVRSNEGDARVSFKISDEIADTPVYYKGILPDLFREGQGVIVQGHLRQDGTVEATEVLAKHDETYMPKEVAEALKEQGRWKEQSDSN